MKQLSCPYIVKYMDAFIESASLYLVLQFCAGGDLKNYLRNAWELQERTIWRISLRIACGLSYLHAHHVLHRDLKSENIFLEGQQADDVLIGDLGLAKVLDHTTGVATTFCGTPRYISPEGFSNDRYDTKCDVWAFGIILYELCSGGHCGPWDKAVGLPGLMRLVCEEEPPALPKRIRSAPLGSLCTSLLLKDYRDRPSIEDFLTMPSVTEAGEKCDIVLDHRYGNDSLKSGDSAQLQPAMPRRRVQTSSAVPPSLLEGPLQKMCCSMRSCVNSHETALGPRFHCCTVCEICVAQGLPTKEFAGLLFRRHHCRNCGRSVCSAHSTGRHGLPQFGYVAPQRICDVCQAYPLGSESRSSRLLIIAAGKRAFVWNSRSLTSATCIVGDYLGWVGVASPSSAEPELLCVLSSQPGAELEMRDLTKACSVQHRVAVSSGSPKLANTFANTVLWHLSKVGPLDLDSTHEVAMSGSLLVVLQRDSPCATFRVLEVPGGTCVGHCSLHEEVVVTCLVVHRSRKGYVLAGTKTGAVMIWTVPIPGSFEICELLCVLHGHTDLVTCISVSEDGRLICSGSKDGTVRLWRRQRRGAAFTENSLLHICQGYQASKNTSVCCYGDYLVYIRSPRPDCVESLASVWNLLTGSWERDIYILGHSVAHVALRDSVLVTASTNCGFWSSEACRIHLWHVPTGIQLAEFTNPSTISWLLLAEVPDHEEQPEPSIREDTYGRSM